MQPANLYLARFIDQFRTEEEPRLTHLNPPWTFPQNLPDVTIYVRKNNGFIKTKGYYDMNRNTWAKANGVAVTILGWTD